MRGPFSRALLIASIGLAACDDDGPSGPGAADHLRLVIGGEQQAVVGSVLALPVVVEVLDARGRPVAGEFVRAVRLVTLGALPVPLDSGDTDVDGRVEFPWTLMTVAGTQVIEFAVEGIDPLRVTATATPGPPTRLRKVSGDAQFAVPGAAVTQPPSVKVTDAWSNPVAGVDVLFSVVSDGGAVSGAAVTTNAAGIAAVGSWTLGQDQGTHELQATSPGFEPVTFTASAAPASPNMSISITVPFNYTVVEDSVQVLALITATNGLTGVRARIGATEVSLQPEPPVRWLGTLHLGDLPSDTALMIITATDATGAETDAFRWLIRDRRPVISAPFRGAVARPNLQFHATCADDDPAGCSSLRASVGSTILATGTSEVSASLSLGAFEGRIVDVIASGTDSRGQSQSATSDIWVESSAALTEIGSGGFRVLDARGSRILYIETVTGGLRFVLQDVSSGILEVIPGLIASTSNVSSAFLTSRGAIIIARRIGDASTALLDWRDRMLSVNQASGGFSNLAVNGDWAVFSTRLGGVSTAYRRDLLAGSDVTVAAYQGDLISVAPDGTVAFTDVDGRISLDRNGSITVVSTDDPPGFANSAPLTDGSRVVYRRRHLCCGDLWDVVLRDGPATIVLSQQRQPGAGSDYTINDGWVAFTAPHSSGSEPSAWIRSPDGELSRVSFLATPSKLDALSDGGALVFRSGGRRFRAASGAAAVSLMSELGTVEWRGEFVALLGRTAFRIP